MQINGDLQMKMVWGKCQPKPHDLRLKDLAHLEMAPRSPRTSFSVHYATGTKESKISGRVHGLHCISIPFQPWYFQQRFPSWLIRIISVQSDDMLIPGVPRGKDHPQLPIYNV